MEMSAESDSPFLARDYRYFDIARQVALGSDFKIRIGAVAVCGGKVIATAASSEKTHSLQAKYNRYRRFEVNGVDCLPKVHAEIGLVTKLRRVGNIDFKRVRIYVYRLCKARPHGLARPCAACMRALVDLGVERVYYTTDYGYAVEVIGRDKEGVEWTNYHCMRKR